MEAIRIPEFYLEFTIDILPLVRSTVRQINEHWRIDLTNSGVELVEDHMTRMSVVCKERQEIVVLCHQDTATIYVDAKFSGQYAPVKGAV